MRFSLVAAALSVAGVYAADHVVTVGENNVSDVDGFPSSRVLQFLFQLLAFNPTRLAALASPMNGVLM